MIIPLSSECERAIVLLPGTIRHHIQPDQAMSTNLSEKTIAKVQDILMNQLGVKRDQIIPEARIMADLGADSLDMVEIGMTAEELFHLTLPDEVMDNVHTVGDLHEVLGKFLERTGQPA